MSQVVFGDASERLPLVGSGGRIETLTRTEPCLDGLRALAVLPTCFIHFHVPGFAFGGYGVDVFFVLSGYLITRVLYTSQQRGRGLSVFYWHRLVRLFPVLLIVSFSIFLLPGHLLYRAQAWQDVLATLTYVSNWTIPFGRGAPVYLAHTWSLSMEEQFYLLWPLLFLAMMKRGHAVAGYGTSLLLAVALAWLLVGHHPTDTTWLAFAFDIHIGGLLVGCLLAQLGTLRSPAWAAAGAVAFYALAVVFGFGNFGRVAVWLATAIIIDHSVSEGDSLLKKALAWKGAVYIGLISYSLYLWNFPVSNVVFHTQMSLAQQTVVGVGASLALASATYVLVERPCRAARDRLPPQITGLIGRMAAVYAAVGIAVGIVYFWSDDIANAFHPKPLEIVAFAPNEIKAGEGFNVQPDGRSVFWIKLTRSAPRAAKIILGTEPRETAVLGSMVIGFLPKQAKLAVGTLPLRLVDADGRPLVAPTTLRVR